MKYRVKFKCYWYNTGGGDNGHYMNHEDFDTLEEAQKYQTRVIKQRKLYADNSEGWVKRNSEWENSEDFIEIENGYIAGDPTIVKFYPEYEESI